MTEQNSSQPEPTEAVASEVQQAEAVPLVEPSNSKLALFRVLAGLALIIALAVATHNFGTFLIVLGVVMIVMLHELGHFLVAKASGMKVTEYFLGFGPRVWSFRRGEIEYGIKAIPAGGYVKIIGMVNLEEVDPKDEPRTYRAKPYWQRVAVAFAGPAVHFIIAVVILFVLFAGTGVSHHAAKIGQLADVENGVSPAKAAGLRPGDKIVVISGKRVTTWEDASRIFAATPGKTLSVTVERPGGTDRTLSVTPVRRGDVKDVHGNVISGDQNSGFVGMLPTGETVNVRTSVPTAIGRSVTQTADATKIVVGTIGHIFSPSGISSYLQLLTAGPADNNATNTQTPPPSNADDVNGNRFVSPLGLFRIASDAAHAGLGASLTLLFSIDLFLGIFNLIPLAPFDGGHIAVATYEKIRSLRSKTRYSVDYAKVLPVSYAVLMVLVFIGLSAMWLDIFNPIPNVFE